MGILGTDADWASDVLILSEIVISLLVLIGVVFIRRDRRRVRRHRAVMLWVLALNAFFLSGFLVQDIVRQSSTIERSAFVQDKPWLFWSMLGVHLAIAISAIGVAIASWLIARKGVVQGEHGMELRPEVRSRHRRVSRYYPWLWASTLVTGLLLYSVLYLGG